MLTILRAWVVTAVAFNASGAQAAATLDCGDSPIGVIQFHHLGSRADSSSQIDVFGSNQILHSLGRVDLSMADVESIEIYERLNQGSRRGVINVRLTPAGADRTLSITRRIVSTNASPGAISSHLGLIIGPVAFAMATPIKPIKIRDIAFAPRRTMLEDELVAEFTRRTGCSVVGTSVGESIRDTARTYVKIGSYARCPGGQLAPVIHNQHRSRTIRVLIANFTGSDGIQRPSSSLLSPPKSQTQLPCSDEEESWSRIYGAEYEDLDSAA